MLPTETTVYSQTQQHSERKTIMQKSESTAGKFTGAPGLNVRSVGSERPLPGSLVGPMEEREKSKNLVQPTEWGVPGGIPEHRDLRRDDFWAGSPRYAEGGAGDNLTAHISRATFGEECSTTAA